MKTKKFCNFCSGPLDVEVLECRERQVCKDCNQIYYENPLPVVSVILANEQRELLLVKRANDPCRNMWCFPTGFVEIGESIEDAALRELMEETGVEGQVSQVVDVCCDETDVYGGLLVVTFEAEKVGGQEVAGDDAIDFGYFPLENLPKLAFDFQSRALQKYIDIKKDIWDMGDSLRKLLGEPTGGPPGPEKLLSDELLTVIERASLEVIGLWVEEVSINPSTSGYHRLNPDELASRGRYIIGQLVAWLQGAMDESGLIALYLEVGAQRKSEGIDVEEVVSSLSILKKHIFHFTINAGAWNKAVDYYRLLEMAERIVYFFDRAGYYILKGYGGKYGA